MPSLGLLASILASSVANIDESIVNVALPADGDRPCNLGHRRPMARQCLHAVSISSSSGGRRSRRPVRPASVLILAALSRWAGGLLDQFGARLPLMIGPAIAALGIGLMGLTVSNGSYWELLVSIAILGFGMVVTVAPLTATVIDAVPAHETGVASARHPVNLPLRCHSGVAGKGDQNHRIADCNASLLCKGLTRPIICIYRYARG